MHAYKSCSDAELVAAARHGDKEAYGEIVTRYKDRLFAVVLRILPDHYAAEDVAQETFVDGFFGLSSLREPEKVFVWLCGIARRKALHTASRRQHFEDIGEYADTLPATAASPEERIIQEETACAVRAALSVLSEKNRAVAGRFYLEDQSITEIAQTLAIPIGTVKRRLYDARRQLKGELAAMREDCKPSATFEKDILKKITQLQLYCGLHDGSYEGFQEAYREMESLIEQMPESIDRQFALAGLYQSAYWKDGGEEWREKMTAAAKRGRNAEVLCDMMVDVLINEHDYNQWLHLIDKEYLPQMREMRSPCGEGVLNFWRGVAQVRLGQDATADFDAAVRLVPSEDIYHATAVAAQRTWALSQEYTEVRGQGIHAMGEQIKSDGGKWRFVRQPGFSVGLNANEYAQHRLDALFFHLSRCGRVLLDMTMTVGDTCHSEHGTRTRLPDSKAVVPAGTFSDCRCFHVEGPKCCVKAWFADGVGLVKAELTDGQGTEVYELAEMRGTGEGFFPVAVGNYWRYVKADIPPHLYQCFERTVTYADEETVNFAVISIVALKREWQRLDAADSELYIARCTALCDQNKVDEAIAMLRQAVRANTTQNAAVMALAGIEYLTRVRDWQAKGYRLCPSSINGSYLLENDGVITYNEAAAYSFGPHRLGTRHEENRIFGVKPFRYLQLLTGKLYDPRWVAGYHEEFAWVHGAIKVQLDVSDGGTVTTAAGTFADCLKVTLHAENDTRGQKDYFHNFEYVDCGVKEFWFAPSVGIVRFVFTWGESLRSESELVAYSVPAAEGEMMPVMMGNHWEYDEVNLTAEGYRAKRINTVAAGMGRRFLLTDAQEFLFLGTEEEYEAFKKKK